MVTKFLDENKPKTSLKSEFALFRTTAILFNFVLFVKCWRNLSGVESERTPSKLRKRKRKFYVVFTYPRKPARAIRKWKFHVAVVRRRPRNVQKGVITCKVVVLPIYCFWGGFDYSRRRSWLSSLSL